MSRISYQCEHGDHGDVGGCSGRSCLCQCHRRQQPTPERVCPACKRNGWDACAHERVAPAPEAQEKQATFLESVKRMEAVGVPAPSQARTTPAEPSQTPMTDAIMGVIDEMVADYERQLAALRVAHARVVQEPMTESKRYAADTEVAPEKSRAQLERLLKDHGAKEFHSGWDSERDIIEFGFRNLQIRFILKRPNRVDFSRFRYPDKAIAQADRQRWRALFLVVRAKLEAVESGLAIIENEFLANIVTASNQTIGEILQPRLAAGDFDVRRALPAAPGATTDQIA